MKVDGLFGADPALDGAWENGFTGVAPNEKDDAICGGAAGCG